MIIFASLIFSMYITIALIPVFNKLAYRINALDVPDDRKVHTIPVPRIGGIAMALGVFPALFFWVPMSPFLKSFFISSGILVTFGAIDDFKGLDFKIKFLGQILASLVVILYGQVQILDLGTLLPSGIVLPNWLSVAFTILVVVGVTNAINLSDGLDGLAGGVTLLSFILLAYLAFCFENSSALIISVTVIGSIFGFLRYNSYPAVLFMGDTGSQLLGFWAIVLSLFLTQNNSPLSPVLPLFIIGFPIIDTVTVMCSRIAAGLSPFRPDKRHFHHRLITIGLYHTEAVLTIYFLQFFFVTSAFLFRFSSEWFLLIYYLIFSGCIFTLIYLSYKMKWKLNRSQKFNVAIKGRLRVIKDKKLLIKFSFASIKYLFFALLIFSCFIPKAIPMYFSILSIVLLAVFLITWKINKDWISSFSAIMFYLLIPLLIYFGESNPADWVNEIIANFQTTFFVIFIIFVYLTLKFTRRKEGFKTTPLDFLILFSVLVIPNLPDTGIKNLNFGPSAVKIIILYLGFEVLTGELREKVIPISLLVSIILSIIAVRGFL